MAGHVVREEQWIYRRATAELEAELAARVDELLRGTPSARLGDGRGRPAPGESDAPDQLTAEQQAALEAAFEHRLSVITGGPGTGKTASIKTIAARATERGARVMLVAPTGRAAVRMTEASGLRARTVHSALGWIPGEGPTHDEQDPLTCDLLIVDETSMANLELLVTLLRAVGDGTNVVLVGDADQLAPVGAGKPFAELVAAEGVPVARLTHIFRQAADSMIVQGAHAIRGGHSPSFSAGEGMRRDLFLIDRASPQAALEEIVSLVSERLPGPLRGRSRPRHPGVRARLPRRSGHRRAQPGAARRAQPRRPARARRAPSHRRQAHDDRAQPPRARPHERHRAAPARRGRREPRDRRGRGRRGRAHPRRRGRRVPHGPEDADRLQLAYACSVHRGQGIELPISVIVAHPAAGAFFLRREMLYTAITRARLATVIVGSRDVVARAARTPDTARRYGRLGERLAGRDAPARTQVP